MNHAITGVLLAGLSAAAARPAGAQEPSDAIYNESVVATYRLTMAAADWNAIVNDPFGSGDKWKRCAFQWQSDPTVYDVGVKAVGTNRYAGNPKPAVRIKFDEFVPSREWRGVDNIKLEGNIMEGFRERLSYWTDRQFGVPAPRACHAILYVNGDLKGVYAAVEPVRKKFVKYHFKISNPDGNLYKIDRKPEGNPTWRGDHYLWRGSDPATYVPLIWEPITNENGGNYSDVVTLLDIVNNVSQSLRRGRLEQHINLDKFYSYLALLAATGDYDSVLAGDAPSTPNNHHWYHREDTNRMQLIPWDRSNAFGVTYWLDATERVNMSIWFGIDPAVTSSTQWDGRSRTNTKMTAWIRPDLIARNTYLARLRLLIDGIFPSTSSRANSNYLQIRNQVYADPYKGQPPQSLTNASFDSQVTSIKNWPASRISGIRPQLPTNNAQFVSHTVPTTMTAGQTLTVSVTMKNIGTATWNGGGAYPYGLGHPAGSTTWTWRSNRVYLGSTQSVAPNGTKTFSFSITAPSTSGTYAFPRWQMVQEGVGYFGAQMPALSITVTGSGGNTVTKAFQNGVAPSSTYAGTRDTYISEASPTTNYGTATPLLLDGDTTGGKDAYVLLKWDVTAIPSGSTVQSAKVKFYVTNASTQTYEFYALNRAWVETQATWNLAATGSSWSVPGAKGSTDRGSTVRGTVTATATGAVTVTLNSSGVSLVQSWVNSPSSNHGFLLADSANADSLQFASREATTASQRPRLEVTYVPPSTTVADWVEASPEDLVDGEENPLTQEDAMNSPAGGEGEGEGSGACGATGLEAILLMLVVLAMRKGART
jgi:hypothetical protein